MDVFFLFFGFHVHDGETFFEARSVSGVGASVEVGRVFLLILLVQRDGLAVHVR
jgi:hypothetical protein